jgi:hypothetical protein
MECLGLHNKPKTEVHPERKLTGPKEEEEEATWLFIQHVNEKSCCCGQSAIVSMQVNKNK